MRHPDHDMSALVKWKVRQPCGTDEYDDKSDNESDEKAGDDGSDYDYDDKWMSPQPRKIPQNHLEYNINSCLPKPAIQYQIIPSIYNFGPAGSPHNC
jgi:hypothetical protein